MKKHFITGLAILLPLVVTLVIVFFVFNLLTEPFVGIMTAILKHYDLLEEGFWIFTGPALQYYGAQFLTLIVLIGFTIWLGVIARWVFFHYFLQLGEKFLNQIPIIRSVYKTSQDVVKTIFTTQSRSFKQVVLAPFPHKDAYSVGLITSDALPAFTEDNRVAVFVPTTPNPTSGYLMMMKAEELIYLDMSVEEALKYVISCGVIAAPFKTMTQEEALQRLTVNNE